MPIQLKQFKVIAIDADDTLWDCQSHFDNAEAVYCQLLAAYAGAKHVSDALFETEKANMDSLGYGTKAFTLSLIENAVKISEGRISGKIIAEILQLGKVLLTFPTTPLPGVEDTLIALNERKTDEGYRLVVFTKGELQDQENKLKRSGLANYFDDIVIVSDKTEEEYRHLCVNNGIHPKELLMIGNSFKSDIAPALSIGAYAIHVPFSVAWKMELAETFDHERLITIENFRDLITFSTL